MEILKKKKKKKKKKNYLGPQNDLGITKICNDMKKCWHQAEVERRMIVGKKACRN
jgi:hypothetical protein